MGQHFGMLPDRYVIDLSKPWHVAWWAERFGVSEEMLHAAIASVGIHAEDVRVHLDGERRKTGTTEFASGTSSAPGNEKQEYA